MAGHRNERGSALLVTMGLSAVLLLLVAGLFLYAGAGRNRAIQRSREPLREGCAQAGLQLAKGYFLNHWGSLNSYLANPAVYNPVKGQWMSASLYSGKCATDPCTSAVPTDATLRTNHPELFVDLDSDGKSDVFLYVRDNMDELPPAKNDWTHDNDKSVFVGALCISSTLAPRRADGAVDPTLLSAEALVTNDTPDFEYKAQGGNGEDGQGNLNKAANSAPPPPVL